MANGNKTHKRGRGKRRAKGAKAKAEPLQEATPTPTSTSTSTSAFALALDSASASTPKLFEPTTEVASWIGNRIKTNPNYRNGLVSSLQHYQIIHTQDSPTKQVWAEIQHLAAEWRSSVGPPAAVSAAATPEASSLAAAELSRKEIFLQNMTAYTESRSRVLGWFDARPNIEERLRAHSITVDEANEVCLLFYNILECGKLLEEEVALQSPGVDRVQLQHTLLGVPAKGNDTSGNAGPSSTSSLAHETGHGEAALVDDTMAVATRYALSAAPTAATSSSISSPSTDETLAFVRSFCTSERHPSQLELLIHTSPVIRLALLQWLLALAEQELSLSDEPGAVIVRKLAKQGYEFWSKKGDLLLLLPIISEANAYSVASFVEAVRQRRHLFSRFDGWLVAYGSRISCALAASISSFFSSSSSSETPFDITVPKAKHLLGILCELIDAQTIINSTIRVQLCLQVHVGLAEYTAAAVAPDSSGATDAYNSNYVLHNRNLASIERFYTRLLTRYPPDPTEMGKEKRKIMNAYLTGCEQLRRVHVCMDSYIDSDSAIRTIGSDNISEELARQAWILLSERKTAYELINQATKQMEILRKKEAEAARLGWKEEDNWHY